MLTVADIWDDAKRVFGICDEEFLYQRVNDAIELLAAKGEWQPLHAYVDVAVDGRNVTLPAEVQTPLAVSLNGNPSLGYDRLFEFHFNGPGPSWEPVEWGWRDGEFYSTMADLPDPEEGLGAYSTSPEDAALELRVFGLDEDGTALRTEDSPGVFSDGLVVPVEYPAAVTFTSVKPSRIDRVEKPASAGRVKLVTSGGDLLGDYQHYETRPRYRRITVPGRTTSARIYFRRTTFKVGRQTDWIPLPQRYALTTMLAAVKEYDNRNIETAMALEANAARMTAENNHAMQPPVSMPIQVQVVGGITDNRASDLEGDYFG